MTVSKSISRKKREQPLIARIPAGFPSPASDFSQHSLDLNELVVEHPAATYYVQVQGYSMLGAGITTGDILVVDRSLEPVEGSIVVAVIDGEFTVKRVHYQAGALELHAENERYKSILVREGMNVELWGVVTYVVHKAR